MSLTYLYFFSKEFNIQNIKTYFHLHFNKLNAIIFSHRGVAQLVARMVRDHEAVGSNPATPTRKKRIHKDAFFLVNSEK